MVSIVEEEAGTLESMPWSVDYLQFNTSKFDLFAVFSLVQLEFVGLPPRVLAHHKLGLELSVSRKKVGVIMGKENIMKAALTLVEDVLIVLGVKGGVDKRGLSL